MGPAASALKELYCGSTWGRKKRKRTKRLKKQNKMTVVAEANKKKNYQTMEQFKVNLKMDESWQGNRELCSPLLDRRMLREGKGMGHRHEVTNKFIFNSFNNGKGYMKSKDKK